MIVAILGARSGVDLAYVEGWVRRFAAKHPDAVVVTTAEPHVGQRVEYVAPRAGLRLASLRPECNVRWAEHKRPLAAPPLDYDNPTDIEVELRAQWRALEAEYDRLIARLLREFVVAVYEMAPGEPTRARALAPVFGSFAEAEDARDALIADLVDKVVVFGNGGRVVEKFLRLGKPEDDVVQVRA